jgi:hypothetical protein
METIEFKYPEVIEECKNALESLLDSDLNYRSARLDEYVSGELSGSRVRMDWTLATKDLEEGLDSKIAKLMFRQAAEDIHDIIENGDAQEVSDPLLKTLNGAKVRGADPKNFEVLQAVLTSMDRKDMRDYTLFVTFHVDW